MPLEGIAPLGSPSGGNIRAFLTVTILTGALDRARRASSLAYLFEGTKPLGFVDLPAAIAHPSFVYRNPIALAQEWHGILASGECATRAGLARRLGVSRARVTQVLDLLALDPEALQALAAVDDPMPKEVVTERSLRRILKMPADEQNLAVRGILVAAAVD